MLKFPKKFYWGAAISAEQSEGFHNSKKGRTYWDILFDKKPELFFDKISNKITNDSFNRYKEDLQLCSELKLNSLRNSFSWSRLFPDGKNLNNEAVKYYHDYLDEAKSKNIEVFMCLSHFDMPEWIVSQGGLESKKWIDSFFEYAKFIFNEYGSKIKYFATFNEPYVSVWAGYQSQYHYPQIEDKNKAFQVGYNLVLAHARVAEYFAKNIKNKFNTKLGIISAVSPTIPKNGVDFSTKDLEAAKKADIIHNYGLLDAMALGKISQEIIDIKNKLNISLNFNSVELKIIKSTKLDFIGINFYQPFRVEAISNNDKINPNIIGSYYYKQYIWPKAKMNIYRGWEIRAKSLYDICKVMEQRYPNIPFYISENGMGVENEERFLKNGVIEDSYRIEFLKEHLFWLYKAINDLKINCFGYHCWTSVDCWSWLNAYKNRYGLIALDLKTQKRTIKKSGQWYKKLIENNGFNLDINIEEIK